MPISKANQSNFFWVFLGLFFLFWLGQAEYLLFISSASPSFADTVWLVLGQSENILVSALVASPWLLRRKMYRRESLIWLAVVVIVSLYILLNQVFYKLFLSYVTVGHVESSRLSEITRLYASFVQELDFFFWLNLLLVLAWLGIFFVNRHHPFQLNSKGLKFSVMGFVLLSFVAEVLTLLLLGGNSLSRHPVLVLFSNQEQPVVLVSDQNLDLYSLRYGSELIDPVYPLPRDRINKPNIIFIIIESVGSEGLLLDGRINESVAPNLASLQTSSIVFDNITNIFPSTTRSHVPIATGGSVFTWGSISYELQYKYTGATLVGEMSRGGYQTGLFSATYLDFELLDRFYENLDFDKLDVATVSNVPDSFKMNSWGANENYLLPKMFNWIDENRDSPFFLQILTNSTHHPYSVPKSLTPAFTGRDRLSRYKSSIHFTDAFIAEIIAGVKERNLDDNTWLVISGDHGQAFSDKHSGNLGHKNFLFEENVNNFLLLVDLSGVASAQSVKRRGQIADIMPTILDVAHLPESEVKGQSLLSNAYREKIAYFHKMSNPAMWGLRDGNFKFTDTIVGASQPELYDLNLDPDEQHNLAEDYPQQVEQYAELVGNWYVRQNSEYIENLADYEFVESKEITVEDLSIPGPKSLMFGYRNALGEFKRLETIHPNEDMVIYTMGVAFGERTLLSYGLIAPDQSSTIIAFSHDSHWTTSYLGFSRSSPMAEGIWTVRLTDQHQEYLSRTFEVSKNAILIQDYFSLK